MRLKLNRAHLVLLTLLLTIWLTSCQKATDPKLANANSNAGNSNTAATPAPSQAVVPSSDNTGPVSLTTPTETYKTGYAARQRKDLVTLKRVLSKDAIEFLTEVGKEEEKTLDDQLRALSERPQASTAETRNEKISGDRASLEYLDEKGKWQQMEFAKEGNEWKIDLPKAP